MWELTDFGNDIRLIEDLLYEIAGYDNDWQPVELVKLAHSDHYEQVRPPLESFSTKLDKCQRIALVVDRAIRQRIESLLAETNLEASINQLLVRLRISRARRSKLLATTPTVFRAFRRLFRLSSSNSSNIFGSDSGSIEAVLSSLGRLRSLIESLESAHFRQTSNDDEIFKPSNIDIDFVVFHIDAAIEKLNLVSVGPSEKERLVEYLEEAKAELADSSPAWRKVVGALIICSTLLSGLASAPDAIQNINEAVRHILGTSIDITLPNMLPKSKEPPAHNIRPKRNSGSDPSADQDLDSGRESDSDEQGPTTISV